MAHTSINSALTTSPTLLPYTLHLSQWLPHSQRRAFAHAVLSAWEIPHLNLHGLTPSCQSAIIIYDASSLEITSEWYRQSLCSIKLMSSPTTTPLLPGTFYHSTWLIVSEHSKLSKLYYWFVVYLLLQKTNSGSRTNQTWQMRDRDRIIKNQMNEQYSWPLNPGQKLAYLYSLLSKNSSWTSNECLKRPE